MPDPSLKLNLPQDAESIVAFLKKVFRKTGKKKAVIGWSGGIDSTVSLFLLARALPKENIHVIHMPYSVSFMAEFEEIRALLGLPHEHIEEHPIKEIVDTIGRQEHIGGSGLDNIRLGNIMARTRMIILFDRARTIDALVCGTENRTEHLLGYFTRYGDGASDIEPIVGLYKSQVYEMARYLGVPDTIIKKAPSAGLWAGQTDEGEFGFTYEEADKVCHLYFDMKQTAEDIKAMGFSQADNIIDFARKNSFKLSVPYKKD